MENRNELYGVFGSDNWYNTENEVG
jgi:hypothetical protein